METVQFLMEESKNVGGSQQIALKNTSFTVLRKRREVCKLIFLCFVMTTNKVLFCTKIYMAFLLIIRENY